jgi:HK97 family phage portal protein
MTFLDRLKFLIGTKASQARIATSYYQVGQPQTSPLNYESLMRKGYGANATVYACVEKIAIACSGIEWEVYKEGRAGMGPTEIDNHPLEYFLSRPNPMTGGSAFIESLVAYLMLTGNSYIEGVRAGAKDSIPYELWPVRPDKMKIVPGKEGYPDAYQFQGAGGRVTTWPINPVNMKSDILHIKLFNPLNDWFGMSPLQAAMLSVDQNNAGNLWNLALMQNMANPSGVLQVKSSDANPMGSLNEKQRARLQEDFDSRSSGPRNAGRPMILEGGLEWKQIMLSPKELDFLKGKEVNEIDICKVFGVPPELVGIGQKTYANYEEARLAFYTDTVLPLMDRLKSEFNNWLFGNDRTGAGDGIYLDYDKDDIEALAPLREKLYTRANGANYLTQNEKREMVGYEKANGWDVFVLGSNVYDANASPIMDDSTDTDTEEVDPTEPSEDEPTPTPGNEVQNAGDEEAEDEDEAKSGVLFKSINLINKNEKKSSARRQNKLKAKYEGAMYRDVKEDLHELSLTLANAAQGLDPRLAEYSMQKAAAEFMPTLSKTISRHLSRSMRDFGGSLINQAKQLKLGVETKNVRKFESYVSEYVKKRTGSAISEIEGTTNKKIRSVVKRLVESAIVDGETNVDLADDLLKEFDGLSDSRARLIARTEVASATNNANLEAAKSLEIPGLEKEWVPVIDDRTRDGDRGGADHVAMEGVIVPIDEKFTVPPDADMEGPGDPAGGADQICNCRCVLVFNQRGT